MRLSYGMPSLIECQSIEENLLLCQKLNLDFVEINMNMLYCLPEYNDTDQLRAIKDQYHLYFTMHFPEEIDFGTFYKEIQVANIALFKRYVEYGAKIGVKKINIHLLPGVYITLPDKIVWTYEKFIERYLQNLKSSFEELILIASPYHIQVCVENTMVPEYLKEVFLKLKLIENLFYTYDVGHDAKANYEIEPIYHNLGEKVTHMHLHDYDQVTDHQVLFDGVINITEKLEYANQNQMSVVIEIKTIKALSKSVENLISRHLK